MWGNNAGGDLNSDSDGAAGIDHTCAPGLSGSGNLSSDPQFANAAAGNYQLMRASPCVNAGTNQPWMTGATDLLGHPRICGPSVDMGAYELYVPLTVTHVATTGANVWPYDTWAYAATTLQAAVDTVLPGGTVLVSNGVYSVGGGVNGSPGYQQPSLYHDGHHRPKRQRPLDHLHPGGARSAHGRLGDQRHAVRLYDCGSAVRVHAH